jgi:hypothetical protein
VSTPGIKTGYEVGVTSLAGLDKGEAEFAGSLLVAPSSLASCDGLIGIDEDDGSRSDDGNARDDIYVFARR